MASDELVGDLLLQAENRMRKTKRRVTVRSITLLYYRDPEGELRLRCYHRDMIRSIIFDYDGVLADSDPFNFHALQNAGKEMGITLSLAEYKKYFAGKTLLDGTQEFFVEHGITDSSDRFIALKKSYDPHYISEVEWYPDALDCIHRLQTQYQLAIASGARRFMIEAFIQKYALQGIFSPIVTSEDYTRGKPDPEGYLLTVERLRCLPREAVIIEDSLAGVQSAQRAGIRCIAVTHTHTREELASADHVVDSLQEITIQLLESLG